MRRYILNLFISCTLCVATASCEDYLDTTNERDTPAYDELTTLKALRATTASLYTSPWYYFHKSRFIQLGDSRSNNIYNNDSGSNDYNVMATFNEANENNALTYAWGSLYNVITQSAYVIDDYAPYCVSHGVCTQEEANVCVAEARFMRSLAYWFLAMYWHDVPIVENAVTVSQMAYANRFEDVLQYAICEAEWARKWLPEAPYQTGRVCKTSADVLLSRLYITAGAYAKGGHYSDEFVSNVIAQYYAGDDDYAAAFSLTEFFYAKAIAASERAINEGPKVGFGMMDDYEEIFRVQNNNNKEVLFAIQFAPGNPSTYGLANELQGQFCYDRCIDNDYGSSFGTFASYDFIYVSLHRGGLSRTRGNIFPVGMTYDYLYHEIDTCSHYGEIWTVLPDNPTTGTSKNSIGIKKHVVGGPIATNNQAFKGNSALCTPMLRFSEAYLNLTEAYMGLYNQDETTNQHILSGVNEVRRRAYKIERECGTYPGDYGIDRTFDLDDLLQERRMEFYMEGVFWSDIVRRSFMGDEHLERMLDYQNNRLMEYENDSIMGCHRLYGYRYEQNLRDPDGLLGTIELREDQNTGQYVIARPSRECVHSIGEDSYCHSNEFGEGDNLWSMIYPPIETTSDPNLLQAPVSFDFSEIITNKSAYHE